MPTAPISTHVRTGGTSRPIPQAHEVVLSIGCNCGPRHTTMQQTALRLGQLLDDMEWSGTYQTDALPDKNGLTPYPTYLNAVARGIWHGTLDALQALLKEMERSCGRDAPARRAGRVPLDIDIVLADGLPLRHRDIGSPHFTQGLSRLAHARQPG